MSYRPCGCEDLGDYLLVNPRCLTHSSPDDPAFWQPYRDPAMIAWMRAELLARLADAVMLAYIDSALAGLLKEYAEMTAEVERANCRVGPEPDPERNRIAAKRQRIALQIADAVAALVKAPQRPA